MGIHVLLIIALAGSGVGVVGLPAIAATAATSNRALVARADDVYHRAAALVERTPRSHRQRDALAKPQARAGQFYAREVAFQRDVTRLGAHVTPDPQRAQLMVRLGEFATYVDSATSASLTACNVRTAKANLRVARELLGEIHAIAGGHGHTHWIPHSLDASAKADDRNRCT